MTTVRVSSSSFREMVGSEAPLELIDGQVVVVAPEGFVSSVAHTRLVVRFGGWVEAASDRGFAVSDCFCELVEGVTVGPDVAWFAPGRAVERRGGFITTVPDLVAEVLSPTTTDRDRGPKRDAYAAAGVRELWLVDPGSTSVLVARRVDGGGLGDVATLATGDHIATPLLPGLEISVAELFRLP